MESIPLYRFSDRILGRFFCTRQCRHAERRAIVGPRNPPFSHRGESPESNDTTELFQKGEPLRGFEAPVAFLKQILGPV